MRLRTVPKAVALLREEDPDTPLSEKIMHRLIKQGYIPTVHSGNKLYIDVDRVPNRRHAGQRKSTGRGIRENPAHPGSVEKGRERE